VCKEFSTIDVFVEEVMPFMFNVVILIVSVCYQPVLSLVVTMRRVGDVGMGLCFGVC
jgi:hypothetical protein